MDDKTIEHIITLSTRTGEMAATMETLRQNTERIEKKIDTQGEEIGTLKTDLSTLNKDVELIKEHMKECPATKAQKSVALATLQPGQQQTPPQQGSFASILKLILEKKGMVATSGGSVIVMLIIYFLSR